MIEQLLAPTPYELVTCELTKVGREWFLRIFIDREGGITLDHCSEVTKLVLDAVEANDPLDLDYQIEVSSPGVDRPLIKPADFQRFLKERVSVKLHAPVDGRKQFTGTLLALDGDHISLENEDNGQTYSLALGDIAKATLKPILNFS